MESHSLGPATNQLYNLDLRFTAIFSERRQLCHVNDNNRGWFLKTLAGRSINVGFLHFFHCVWFHLAFYWRHLMPMAPWMSSLGDVWGFPSCTRFGNWLNVKAVEGFRCAGNIGLAELVGGILEGNETAWEIHVQALVYFDEHLLQWNRLRIILQAIVGTHRSKGKMCRKEDTFALFTKALADLFCIWKEC